MKNKVFWEPSISSLEKTNIFNFQNSVNQKYHLDLDGYSDLYNWSIQNSSNFWQQVWKYSNLIFSKPYSQVIVEKKHIWDTEWFRGSKLNYAENLLKYRNNNIAIYFFGENKVQKTLTFRGSCRMFQRQPKKMQNQKSLEQYSNHKRLSVYPPVPFYLGGHHYFVGIVFLMTLSALTYI